MCTWLSIGMLVNMIPPVSDDQNSAFRWSLRDHFRFSDGYFSVGVKVVYGFQRMSQVIAETGLRLQHQVSIRCVLIYGSEYSLHTTPSLENCCVFMQLFTFINSHSVHTPNKNVSNCTTERTLRKIFSFIHLFFNHLCNIHIPRLKRSREKNNLT